MADDETSEAEVGQILMEAPYDYLVRGDNDDAEHLPGSMTSNLLALAAEVNLSPAAVLEKSVELFASRLDRRQWGGDDDDGQQEPAASENGPASDRGSILDATIDVFNAAHKLAHNFPEVGISLIVKPPHGKQFVFATNGMAADGEQRVAGERVQREVQLAEYRQDPRHFIRSRGNIPPESNSRDPPSLAKSDCNDPPPSEPNIPTVGAAGADITLQDGYEGSSALHSAAVSEVADRRGDPSPHASLMRERPRDGDDDGAGQEMSKRVKGRKS